MNRKLFPLVVKTLDDIETFEQVPLSERGLPPSTYDSLLKGASFGRDRRSVIFFPSIDEIETPTLFTHGELVTRVNQTARFLKSLGIQRTDVVSILLPNLPETLFAFFGAEAVGIANPVNHFLEPSLVGAILTGANAKVLFAHNPGTSTEQIDRLRAIVSAAPTVEEIVWVGGRPECDLGGLDFTAELANFPDDDLPLDERPGPGEIAALFHTGGTTGLPKLAKHTHFNEVFGCWSHGVATDAAPDEVRVCGGPLFHVNALCATGLVPLSVGACIVIPTPLGYRNKGVVANLWKIVDRFSVTNLNLVPTLITALLNVPIGDNDISSLEFVGSGTAPLSKQVAAEFNRLTGCQINEGYGLTEATSVSATNPRYGERKIGSIGLRLPYQEMTVAEVDDKNRIVRECMPGQRGVILVRGPNVFPGYVDEKHNGALWVEGGWLNTGDLGWQDAEGYFWISGRDKDQIIRGGHNIDPLAIEEIVYRYPAVRLCAAVAKPDTYAGELPVLYVEPKKGMTIDLEDLQEFVCRESPERAANPKDIYLLEDMPVTTVGKIFRPKLREDATKRAITEILSSLPGIIDVDIACSIGKGTTSVEITVTTSDENKATIEAEISERLSGFHFETNLKVV